MSKAVKSDGETSKEALKLAKKLQRLDEMLVTGNGGRTIHLPSGVRYLRLHDALFEGLEDELKRWCQTAPVFLLRKTNTRACRELAQRSFELHLKLQRSSAKDLVQVGHLAGLLFARANRWAAGRVKQRSNTHKNKKHEVAS